MRELPREEKEVHANRRWVGHLTRACSGQLVGARFRESGPMRGSDFEADRHGAVVVLGARLVVVDDGRGR